VVKPPIPWSAIALDPVMARLAKLAATEPGAHACLEGYRQGLDREAMLIRCCELLAQVVAEQRRRLVAVTELVGLPLDRGDR
jgi:hypothetical protein